MKIENAIDVERGIPSLESLRVENYRALRKIDLAWLTPVTVLQ